MVRGEAMTWLADTDLSAVHGVTGALLDARTVAEVRERALAALAGVVPADVLRWDDVEGPRAPSLRDTRAALHATGCGYDVAIAVRPGAGRTVVTGFGRTEYTFSARDRDVLEQVRPALEDALRAGAARERLAPALSDDPPAATAVVLLDRDGEIVLRSDDADRWLGEHFGTGEHPGWLPEAVAAWLSLPPRPPLVSEREGRRLTVWLVPGDPHALLLEEEVARFRADALARLGLTAREVEVLRAARVLDDEADIAWELFLSRHAVRDRLERLEDKLGVHTAADAVARALAESG